MKHTVAAVIKSCGLRLLFIEEGGERDGALLRVYIVHPLQNLSPPVPVPRRHLRNVKGRTSSIITRLYTGVRPIGMEIRYFYPTHAGLKFLSSAARFSWLTNRGFYFKRKKPVGLNKIIYGTARLTKLALILLGSLLIKS